jgi:serine/threonine protein kinase
MKGTQFPFGLLKVEDHNIRKAFIKKRYHFKDEEERQLLMEKINKLKNISHKNNINLRSTEEQDTSITLVYQYVPYSLEDSFNENPNQTVKDLHKQFIELAIYFAKNGIVTTFNPQRCGTIINEQTSTVKYYLPLSDISLTNSRSHL